MVFYINRFEMQDLERRRYCWEHHLPDPQAWDFKFNTRKMDDGERAALIAKGIEGKRLTYRPTDRDNQSAAIH